MDFPCTANSCIVFTVLLLIMAASCVHAQLHAPQLTAISWGGQFYPGAIIRRRSYVESWVFGREFADGTLKDLLAVPVSRATILLAKFIVVVLWSLLLMVMLFLTSLLLGAAIGLSQGTAEVFWHGTVTLAVVACLVIATVFPFAFFASVGRGYLLPMGVVLLVLVLGNVVTIAGWGTYFPWAVPALYAEVTGKGNLEAASYLLVLLTGLAGMAATYLWWRCADQNR